MVKHHPYRRKLSPLEKFGAKVIKFSDFQAYKERTGVIAGEQKMQVLEKIDSEGKLQILIGPSDVNSG